MQTEKELVEQIHAEFDAAHAKLLIPTPNASSEALYSLGFRSSKSLEDYSPNYKDDQAHAAYYAKHYPNYRFITEKKVAQICAKYGLVCAPVSRFTGEVPVSKVAAMAAFTVMEGDVRERYLEYDGGRPYVASRDYLDNENKITADRVSRIDTRVAHDPSNRIPAMRLWICAPEKDVNMKGLERVGHNVGVAVPLNDPVVLQPVVGGFLIVAAWGLEASDEDVVNHKMN